MPSTPGATNRGMQSIENFSGLKGAQNARRWWKRLVLALKHTEEDPTHDKCLIELFNVKLTHDAARWADDTPEVISIIETEDPQKADVEELKKLFLARFRQIVPTKDKVDRDLEELGEGGGELLDDYYIRARRVLVHVCEDAAVDGSLRVITRAEKQWIKSVVGKFTMGMYHRDIGFQVDKGDPASLEAAYRFAKDRIRTEKKNDETRLKWEQSGYRRIEMGSHLEKVVGFPLTSPPPSMTLGLSDVEMASSLVARPQPSSEGSSSAEISPMNTVPGRPLEGSKTRPPLPPPRSSYHRPGSTNHFRGLRQRDANDQRSKIGSNPRDVLTPPQPPRGPPQVDLAQSTNLYVNDPATYKHDLANPICVNCGQTGHFSSGCRNRALATWEQEHLRSIVFPNHYHFSRSARFNRGGLELTEPETIKDDETQYRLTSDMQPSVPMGGEEVISSRLSKLSVNETTNTKNSRATSQVRGGGEGAGPSETSPFKTVRIQYLLSRQSSYPHPILGSAQNHRRKDRTDSTSQDKPNRKKGKGV